MLVIPTWLAYVCGFVLLGLLQLVLMCLWTGGHRRKMETMPPLPALQGDSYQLVMPFLSDDPQFALGWEAACVYQKMRFNSPTFEGVFHAANDEQLQLLAQRMGYAAEKRLTEDPGWIWMEFAPRERVA